MTFWLTRICIAFGSLYKEKTGKTGPGGYFLKGTSLLEPKLENPTTI